MAILEGGEVVAAGWRGAEWGPVIGILRGFESKSRHQIGSRAKGTTPDGRTALSGSHDHTLKLWDVATTKELRTLTGHSDRVNSVAFSPDDRASGSDDHTLKLWDLRG
jgi:WD40 repeat protein